MGRSSENANSGAAAPSSADAERSPASAVPPAHGQSRPDSQDLQLRLQEILQRISGADPQQITPEARLIEDIGIDSLGFYEILIEADECLGIKIREEDLLSFRTVGDIQNHLRTLEPSDGQAH
jgi:Acyl carrier protein